MSKFTKIKAQHIAGDLLRDGWTYLDQDVSALSVQAKEKATRAMRNLPGSPDFGAFISTGKDMKLSVIFEKHTSVMGAHPNTKITLPLDRPLTYGKLFAIEDKSGLTFQP